jgi:N-acetyl-anhydromuramyl-L-alanine amidase AmpD
MSTGINVGTDSLNASGTPVSDREKANNRTTPIAGRSRYWFMLVLCSGLSSALTLGFADDQVPWMISRQVAEGLTSARTKGAPDKKTVPSTMSKAEKPEASWRYVVIHHSGTTRGNVQSIHQEHRQRRDADGNHWLGIAYHFVIGNGEGMADGAVEATFRWSEQIHGAHAGNSLVNARGIGICLIGDFEKQPPTKAQLRSVTELVQELAAKYQIPRSGLIGHSSVRATACPGRLFPLERIRKLIPEG